MTFAACQHPRQVLDAGLLGKAAGSQGGSFLGPLIPGSWLLPKASSKLFPLSVRNNYGEETGAGDLSNGLRPARPSPPWVSSFMLLRGSDFELQAPRTRCRALSAVKCWVHNSCWLCILQHTRYTGGEALSSIGNLEWFLLTNLLKVPGRKERKGEGGREAGRQGEGEKGGRREKEGRDPSQIKISWQ